MEEIQAIVIDNGSGVIKAGFAGDDAPKSVFPSIFARPKPQYLHDSTLKECYVGDEALLKRDMLDLDHPIQQGKVVNWDQMERVWHHVYYNELRAAPEEHPVLLTDSALLSSQSDREKMTQIQFETFNVPGLYITPEAVLALYASDRMTGLVVQSGESITYAVPVKDGRVIKDAAMFLNMGGRTVTGK
eukprot:Colp12_sorted_trinity150504_noHs@20855